MSTDENTTPPQDDNAAPSGNTTAAKCPKCDATINLTDDCEIGEIILCDECSAELEVKELEPEPVLDDAPAMEEDWGE